MKSSVLLFSLVGILPRLSAQPVAPEFCAPNTGGDQPASFSRAGQSALRWEKTRIEANPKFEQKIVRTSYRFKHDGQKPITILEIKPSCGCVATQLEKLEFAPGETGELKVTLDLEMDEKVGLQQMTIAITTSEAPEMPTLLQLVVHVPEAVELSSDFVSWDRGEKASPKSIVVTAADGVGALSLSQPSGSSDDFAVEITPEIPGQRYLVKITPKSTDAPSYAQVRLHAESAVFARPVICKLNLNVK